MKIVPLFNKDVNNNSSKLLAIETVTDLNLEKINNYKIISLNCNFSANYLNRLLKLNKFCTIIFNDLKLLLSMMAVQIILLKNYQSLIELISKL